MDGMRLRGLIGLAVARVVLGTDAAQAAFPGPNGPIALTAETHWKTLGGPSGYHASADPSRPRTGHVCVGCGQSLKGRRRAPKYSGTPTATTWHAAPV